MTEVVVVVAAAVVVVDDNAATVVENYFLANCDKFLNDCRHVKPAKIPGPIYLYVYTSHCIRTTKTYFFLPQTNMQCNNNTIFNPIQVSFKINREKGDKHSVCHLHKMSGHVSTYYLKLSTCTYRL